VRNMPIINKHKEQILLQLTKQDCTIYEIAKKQKLAYSSAYEFIQWLEREKYIERVVIDVENNGTSKKKPMIRITNEGKSMLKAIKMMSGSKR